MKKKPTPTQHSSQQPARHTIAEFQVASLIGRGRWSTVVAATKPSEPKPVAVKLLPKQIGENKAHRAAFSHWVEKTQVATTPPIIPLLNMNYLDNRPYFSMPIIAGGSLAKLINKNMLTPKRVHRIMKKLGHALQIIHEAEWVHGSLHPSNVIFDKKGTLYLSDAALAPILAQAMNQSVNLPGYISPEQISGQTVNGRSDFYSFGILIYEMLTGVPPYTSDTPALITMAQMSQPVGSVQEQNQELSPVYDSLIQRLTAVDPANRPQTAVDLIELVEQTISKIEGKSTSESEYNLPLFNKLAIYNKTEATDEERLARIEEIRQLKEDEELASQRRMGELMEIENARQAKLKEQLSKQNVQERRIIAIMFFIIAGLALIAILYFIFQAVGGN